MLIEHADVLLNVKHFLSLCIRQKDDNWQVEISYINISNQEKSWFWWSNKRIDVEKAFDDIKDQIKDQIEKRESEIIDRVVEKALTGESSNVDGNRN